MFDIDQKTRKKVLERLEKEKILVLGRFDAPTDYLANYLSASCASLYLIKAKLTLQKDTPFLSHSVYKYGRLEKEKLEKQFLSGTQNTFFDTFLLIFLYAYLSIYLIYFFLVNRDYQLIIGVGPYNALMAFFYALINPNSKSVYFSEDKVDYHGFNLIWIVTKWCDSLAKKACFQIWFIGDGHMNIYKEPSLKKKSVFVPEPIIKCRNSHTNNEKQIVFLGSLSPEQGSELVYSVFKSLMREGLKIRLLLIGSGKDQEKLKKSATEDGLEKRITFTGFLTDRGQILKLLSQSDIGLALYNPYIYQNLAFGQSSKISNYLGCALPVILTGEKENTPSMAKYVTKYNLGFVCRFEENEVFAALKKLLIDEKLYHQQQENTKKFVKLFDQNNIYPYALSRFYG